MYIKSRKKHSYLITNVEERRQQHGKEYILNEFSGHFALYQLFGKGFDVAKESSYFV
jgi:hypothetical protein